MDKLINNNNNNNELQTYKDLIKQLERDQYISEKKFIFIQNQKDKLVENHKQINENYIKEKNILRKQLDLHVQTISERDEYIRELEKKNSELIVKITNLNKDIKINKKVSLKKDKKLVLDVATSCKSNFRNDYRTLNNSYDALRQEIHRIRIQNGIEIATLKANLNESKHINLQLESDIINMQSKIDFGTETIETLQSQIDIMSSNFLLQESQLIKSEINQTRIDNEEIRTSRDLTRSRNNTPLARSISPLARSISPLARSISPLARSISPKGNLSTSRSISPLKDNNISNSYSINSPLRNRDNYATKYSTFSHNQFIELIEKLELDLQYIRNENDKTKLDGDKIILLENEIESLKESHMIEFSETFRNVSDMQSRVISLSNENIKLTNENKELQLENNSIENEKNKIIHKSNQDNETLNILNNKNEELIKKIINLENKTSKDLSNRVLLEEKAQLQSQTIHQLTENIQILQSRINTSMYTPSIKIKQFDTDRIFKSHNVEVNHYSTIFKKRDELDKDLLDINETKFSHLERIRAITGL